MCDGIDHEGSHHIFSGSCSLISHDGLMLGNRNKIVDCLLDEVIGLSLTMERAIAMPEYLYEGTVVS